jgi:hypothetical protein
MLTISFVSCFYLLFGCDLLAHRNSQRSESESDLAGKKHYQLKTHHLKRLVTYVEKGGVLYGHKDMPEMVHEELYIEE